MRPLPFLILFTLLAGCVEHRLVVKRPNPTGTSETVSSNAFGWGAIQHREAAKCTTNLIDEVRVHQNFGQALATVLTLGLYTPVRIEYFCANVPSPVGNTDQ